jgi:hypothetical protein
VTPSLHDSTVAPLCPRCSSHVPMVPSRQDFQSSDGNELLKWHCSHCAHAGMTARQGIQLIFRSGLEYVFAYGSSNGMLTVMLSREAIALFKTHHIGADELARRAAEWWLLLGRPNGMVNLGLRHEEMAAFYWYYYSQSADSQPA